MFDIFNPQQRERLLVVLAGIALCILAVRFVPAQFGEISRSKTEQTKLINDINEHKRHARNEAEIKSRVSAIETQALASAGTPAGSEAITGYRDWLRELADDVGIKGYSASPPTTSGGGKGTSYTKHTFQIKGEGRLEHIAEFMRRFHNAKYLHMIQQAQPSPKANQPGTFTVSFRIEALSLPQIKLVNMPGNDGHLPSDDAQQMLSVIRDRAILSEYTPPPPVVENPPPVVFENDARYCVLMAIVETDRKPQCWINHWTQGRKYYLFEEESFMLEEVRCVIKKIDIDTQRIQIDIGGGLYSLRVGGNFDDNIEAIVVPSAIESPE